MRATIWRSVTARISVSAPRWPGYRPELCSKKCPAACLRCALFRPTCNSCPTFRFAVHYRCARSGTDGRQDMTVVTALRAELGEDAVAEGEAIVARHLRDWIVASGPEDRPLALVRPRSAE